MDGFVLQSYKIVKEILVSIYVLMYTACAHMTTWR